MFIRKYKTELLATLVCGFAFTNAQAAYLYEWDASATLIDATGEATVSDPSQTVTSGQDIEAVWFASDDDYYYFRMDLVAAPDSSSFSGLYGIYIDSADGGAIGSNIEYVPDVLNGVDQLVDSHYEPNIGGWFIHDYHEWNESAQVFERSSPVSQQQSENGGRTLEWKINREMIGDEFIWVAATHDLGSATSTYDITAAVSSSTAPVPLPLPLLTFLSTLIGLVSVSFRKK